MDGTLQVTVSGGQDMAGNVIAPGDNTYEFVLDATLPPSPEIALTSLTCDTATLSWYEYVPPDDLAGFRLEDDPRDSIAGFHVVVLLNGNQACQ